MASQLAIEITLESAQACMFIAADSGARPSTSPGPSYTLSEVNLIPEILEFDASYDALFLKGLQEGGVPIKFSSWHTFTYSTAGAANVNLQVAERSRSVKAIFAVQRRAPATFWTDSGALLFATTVQGGGVAVATHVTLQTFQFRIGGRYFPAAPVQCSDTIGSTIPNGGAEAWIELQKAMNMVGDYRLSSSVNVTRWALSPSNELSNTVYGTSYPETDYTHSLTYWNDGTPRVFQVTAPSITAGNSFASPVGSACFAMSTDLETSNGIEISGLNAEEQSDIALLATYSSAQEQAFNIEVYCYYDSLMILRENNVVEIFQ